MKTVSELLKVLFKQPEPVDSSETDQMVAKALKQSQQTLKKIENFNTKLEHTQTYFIAKAMGRVH